MQISILIAMDTTQQAALDFVDQLDLPEGAQVTVTSASTLRAGIVDASGEIAPTQPTPAG